MNRNILKLAAAAGVVLALVCGCTKNDKTWSPKGAKDGGGTNQETVADYSKLTAANHPRAILTKDAETSIKQKLQAGTDANITKLHNLIMTTADNALNQADLVWKLDGTRLLAVASAAVNRIIPCAYAYRITGEQKYLEKAERDLYTVCTFKNWNALSHFLDAGEMAYAVGIGYDWLYKDLKDETKTAAVNAIQNFAFTFALNNNPWFYTSHTNWNQVCNGGLVVAALAIYEKCPDEAKAIIDKAVETNAEAMDEIYNPNGNYPEGYGYWGYGTAYECIMLSAMESCTGSDNGLGSCEGFKTTGKWIMFMEGMNNQAFNYCDSGSGSSAMPALWYLAHKFKDPSMLYVEKDKLDDARYTNFDNPNYYTMAIVYADKIGADAITAPEERQWVGHGINPVGIARGDWSFTESDKFLGLKAGRCNYSHGHMDVGSFVYDACGVRWSCDYGPQSYTSVENYNYDKEKYPGGDYGSYEQLAFRWGVFRYNNYNHSTITINDALHLVKGQADIDETINKNGRLGFHCDLSSVVSDQCKKAERTVCIVNDKDLEVTDAVEALYNKAAKVRWTMVTQAQPTVESDKIVLKRGGKTMHLTVKAENGTAVTLKTWSTQGEAWDADNSGYYEVGYEATLATGQKDSFTAVLSPAE